MACRYKEGDRVFQSDTKAIEMYVRAAELGLSKALAGIGQYYEHGIVVEEDMSKALDFYEVAAKKGYYYAKGLSYWLKIVGSIPSAPDIQESYWEDQGFDHNIDDSQYVDPKN